MASEHDHQQCIEGVSFKCMHSKEAIQMLLSHAPLRYSIKELSQLTGFHRNTIRPAVKELTDKEVISNFGTSQYFSQSISEHFRNLAKSIYSIDDGLSEDTKQSILRTFGRNLVQENLKKVISEEYMQHFNHSILTEALLHLKMSYPFADVTNTPDGSGQDNIRVNVKFELLREYDTGNELDLKISPCLCQGETNQRYMCEMVAGAIEGGILSACQSEPKEVVHNGSGINGNGQYCQYYIKVDKEMNDPHIKAAEELDLI
ncbi:MAG: hypothetical protein ACXAE3_03085 [Candidatus Kariarchaeaceae archaeon]|jgi:DNA-binding transcriptional regulator YhcF (GntR family)